jgi:hypothetical protein
MRADAVVAFLGQLDLNRAPVLSIRLAFYKAQCRQSCHGLRGSRHTDSQDRGKLSHREGTLIVEGLEHLLLPGEQAHIGQLLIEMETMQPRGLSQNQPMLLSFGCAMRTALFAGVEFPTVGSMKFP